MTLDEFREKYCGMCGSQRCLASDEDIAECGYNPDSKDPLEDVLKAVKEGMEMNKLTHPILRDSENQAHESEYSRETLLHRLAAYEDTGLEPEEVAKLAQAKADGRLVVLPCKVGAEVFATVDCVDVIKDCDDDYDGIGDITCPFEDHCIFEECDDSNQILAETHVNGWWCDDSGMWQVFLDHINAYLRVDDFGKTVFLTRAEAEAALKGAEHDRD
jgi:hypothetical protein